MLSWISVGIGVGVAVVRVAKRRRSGDLRAVLANRPTVRLLHFHQHEGKVVVARGVWQGARLRPGGRLALLGATVAPGFDYADYLARQGVYSLIDRPQVKVLARDQGSPILSAIFTFRERAYVVIQQILPEPDASLLSGILLGIDACLPLLAGEHPIMILSKRHATDGCHSTGHSAPFGRQRF